MAFSKTYSREACSDPWSLIELWQDSSIGSALEKRGTDLDQRPIVVEVLTWPYQASCISIGFARDTAITLNCSSFACSISDHFAFLVFSSPFSLLFILPLLLKGSSANNYHPLSQRAPRSSDSRQVSIQSKKPDTFLALISQSFWFPSLALHLFITCSSLLKPDSACLASLHCLNKPLLT